MRYRRVVVPGATYFFTLVTHERAPLFADAINVKRWRHAVEFVRRKRSFEIVAEVILPDHLHTLWTMPAEEADYPTRLRLIKSAFTRDLGADAPSTNASRARKGERDVWQRRYWEHRIRDEQDFQTHLDYIHRNPVRHGLVTRPADWEHSTFQVWQARGMYDLTWGTDDMPALAEWLARGDVAE